MMAAISSGLYCNKKKEMWTWEHRVNRMQEKKRWVLWTQGCNNWWY
jgi:hypothetical protein